MGLKSAATRTVGGGGGRALESVEQFRYRAENLSRDHFLARHRHPALVLREMLEGTLKRPARPPSCATQPAPKTRRVGSTIRSPARPAHKSHPVHSGGTMHLMVASSGTSVRLEEDLSEIEVRRTENERMVWVAHRRRVGLMEPVTVGRLAACDVVVNDYTVSGEHLVFRRLRGHRWEVVDKGSTNGTRINGQRLRAGVATRIRSGDALSLGRVGLVFYEPQDVYDLLVRPPRRRVASWP